jgi:hypothetical protein
MYGSYLEISVILVGRGVWGAIAMTQPLGNCPGCGADEPFEQVHAGECPDVAGECPEWACIACGAGVFMGTVVIGTIPDAEIAAEQSARAA